MRYFFIVVSAIGLEICSTFYIRFVSEKNLLGMIFFASISPFLVLLFSGSMVESKSWKQRLRLTFALSLGYGIGSFIVAKFNFN